MIAVDAVFQDVVQGWLVPLAANLPEIAAADWDWLTCFEDDLATALARHSINEPGQSGEVRSARLLAVRRALAERGHTGLAVPTRSPTTVDTVVTAPRTEEKHRSHA